MLLSAITAFKREQSPHRAANRTNREMFCLEEATTLQREIQAPTGSSDRVWQFALYPIPL